MRRGDPAAALPRRPFFGEQALELGQEVALSERLLELREERMDIGEVQRPTLPAQDRPYILDVLRTAGEHLQDDQVLDTDHRNGAVPDVDGDRPLDAVILEAGGAEDDIEAKAGRLVKEGEDGCSVDEVVEVRDAQRETRENEGRREGARVAVCRHDSHVDVARRSWKSVRDDGLGTEEDPAVAPAAEDLADEREESGGVRRERHGAAAS